MLKEQYATESTMANYVVTWEGSRALPTQMRVTIIPYHCYTAEALWSGMHYLNNLRCHLIHPQKRLGENMNIFVAIT